MPATDIVRAERSCAKSSTPVIDVSSVLVPSVTVSEIRAVLAEVVVA
jgi:hypothetical protein